MNVFKKLYCRCFQTVFWLALPVLPYRNPEILEHIADIPAILQKNGKQKPLIVTDANLAALGATTHLERELGKQGLPFARFDRCFPNPTTDLVEEAAALYRREGCDCLIAYGGGSPMDLAKAVGVRQARPDVPLTKLAGILKVQKKLPLLIAVPTTAGTGSETTLAAVLVDSATRHKFAINDFPLIPRYTVLDPETIHGLPEGVAATTGLDALTHAVEAYIGRSTTRETRADAEEAVRLIFANLDAAVAHESAAAEKAMLCAAHYAGRAFTRSYVGYIHAVSHSLSGRYDLPHGWTNAVLLPQVLERYGARVWPALARLAVCAGLGQSSESDEALARRFVAAIREKNEKYNIPDHIDAIRAADIPQLARYADAEANPLYPVPVLWDARQLEGIYRAAMPREELTPGKTETVDFSRLVAAQKAYFATGATRPVAARKQALQKLLTAIEENEGALAAALEADLGKSFFESYMCEIALVKSEIRFMRKHLSGYAREHRVKTPLAQWVSRSFTKPVPYGTTLILSPWNYPLLLALDPLADALAAGNTAVVKPSAYAPATSAALARLVAECFPPDYVAVVQGGRKENNGLLDCDFDYIFFTGSKAVGREVMARAARRLIPVTLELGGKSPCIVDESANIELAARRIVFGKFVNCGQTCVAPDYIYCAAAVKERLLAALKKEIVRQYGEAPLQNPDYGKIINQKHFDRICGLIDPAKAVWGGQTDPARQRIAPTVMDGVTWDDAVMQEEIFGPGLPVLSYDRLEDIAADINSRETPLALYIFSENKEHIRFVLERIAFGGGCVNDALIHLATSAMGFGGMGESGMGAYHGKAGFDAFSHYKSIVDKKTFLDLPMRYQPYTGFHAKLIRWFVK